MAPRSMAFSSSRTLYLRGYRRRPLAADALAYYEALACMRGLARAAEHRMSARAELTRSTPRASAIGWRPGSHS
jgi:hypothetical protein